MVDADDRLLSRANEADDIAFLPWDAQENVHLLADHFRAFVAEDSLRRRVEPQNCGRLVNRDETVRHGLGHEVQPCVGLASLVQREFEPARRLLPFVLDLLALGDVTGDGGQRSRCDVAAGVHFQPAIGAVPRVHANLKPEHLGVGHDESRDLGCRHIAIVGMNELEERLTNQLPLAVAEES